MTRLWHRPAAGFFCAILMAGCGSSVEESLPESGVSLKLAQQRASDISEVGYSVEMHLPDSPSEPIQGSVDIGFQWKGTGPLVVDFAAREGQIEAVRLADREPDYRFENGHIVISARDMGDPGAKNLSVDFVAGDGPLNRNEDFMYTLFVPDRASEALPCFDQPDLKARFSLALEMPAAWVAVAGGAEASSSQKEERRRIVFEPTQPIPTYLFAFAAGRFSIVEGEAAGRAVRFFHRETDAAKVERNREELFRLHATALEWLERYTEIRYPFGKFDFVLIPSFQYGGMEHPGSIFYRADGLLLDESATQSQQLGRASVIAHETAHMWFGDLVTMRWFNDVWTKEVFANFMAAKIVHPSFPDLDHDLRFLLAHYPGAYEVDRSQGANPIRQPLENLNQAGSLYGAIIYQKAPIVMRQLERLVGQEPMRVSLAQYLDRFRFSNATWPQLIEILDRRSSLELGPWSRVWVEEPGRPVISTAVRLDPMGERIASLTLRQSDPGGDGRVWTQKLNLLAWQGQDSRRFEVLLDSSEVAVEGAAGLKTPSCILANGDGLAYGRFELDDAGRRCLLDGLEGLSRPLERAVAWLTLWDAVQERQVSASGLFSVGLRVLEREEEEQIVSRLTSDVLELFWRWMSEEERAANAPRLERLLWQRMERAKARTLKATFFGAFRRAALTPDGVQRLRAVWEGSTKIEGLPFSEEDRTRLATSLAVREVEGSGQILDAQLAEVNNPDRRKRLAFVRPALSPDPAVRDAFFETLRDAANRHREPWTLEALGYLNHPLRSRHAVRYLEPALELLEEIQETGDIFFPKRWLDAVFSGHSSPRAAQIVRDFLAQRPDYPKRLREKILQSADPLFRAASR